MWRGPGKLAIEVLEYSAAEEGSTEAMLHARLPGARPGAWLELGDMTGLAL